MSEGDYPEVFLPIRRRLWAVVSLLLVGERARASQEGVPATVFSEGTLLTFLEFVVRLACVIVFPEEALDSPPGRARAARIRRAVTQALVSIMAKEKNNSGEPERA